MKSTSTERKNKNERCNFYVKAHSYNRSRSYSRVFQRAADSDRRARVRYGHGLHKRHDFGEKVG